MMIWVMFFDQDYHTWRAQGNVRMDTAPTAGEAGHLWSNQDG